MYKPDGGPAFAAPRTGGHHALLELAGGSLGISLVAVSAHTAAMVLTVGAIALGVTFW